METSLNGVQQEATGRNPSGSFPGEAQRALFVAPKAPWATFLSWLAGRDLKRLAAICYPESSVEQAADNLDRILTGRHKRHFAVEWLDHLAKIGGEEAEREIVAFVCERYGFQMPERKPDPQREDERLARIERTAQQLQAAATELAAEAAEMRKAKESRR